MGFPYFNALVLHLTKCPILFWTTQNESGDDASPAPKKRATPAAKKKRKVAAGSEEDEQDAKPADTKAEAKAKKVKAKKEEEEAEEIHRWWEEDALGDGSQKWRTLEHQGVLFPPSYEPLPRHVKMLYNGKPLLAHSFVWFNDITSCSIFRKANPLTSRPTLKK